MPVTASNATFTSPEFRTGKKATWVTSTTGFLQKGATVADDHYLRTAINTLTMIHPRPASEYAAATTTTSIWTKWVTNAPYYAYPSAFGGCFPYKWTLSGQPTGMEIEEDLDPTSFAMRSAHGRITWTTPTAGTHTFIIRCTDQEGTTVSRQVSLNVADSNAIWVDGTLGTDSVAAAGTKAAPFAKIANWYGGAGGTGVAGDRADTTYANKIVIYRSGTYVVPEDETAAKINMGSNKPCTHVAYYGETVELDCANSAMRWAGSNGAGNIDRVEMLGLTFSDENEADFTGTYQVFFTGCPAIFCDHTIKNFKNGGTTGSDNPGGIRMSDSGYTDYVQIRNVSATGFGGGTNMGGNAGFIMLFGLRYYEINNVQCLSQDGVTFAGIHQKHDHQYGVSRLCKIMGGNYGNQFVGCIAGLEEDHDGYNEWEYNLLQTTASNRPAIVLGIGAGTGTQGPNQAIRRNTLLVGTANLTSVGTANTIDLSANVIQNTAGGWTINASWTGLYTAQIADLAATSGLVDSDGLLTGSNRTTYLGKKGWEIA